MKIFYLISLERSKFELPPRRAVTKQQHYRVGIRPRRRRSGRQTDRQNLRRSHCNLHQLSGTYLSTKSIRSYYARLIVVYASCAVGAEIITAEEYTPSKSEVRLSGLKHGNVIDYSAEPSEKSAQRRYCDGTGDFNTEPFRADDFCFGRTCPLQSTVR